MRKYPPPQLFIFLFALLFHFSEAFAQTRTLTGVVRDSVNQPLAAATVKVTGQKSSTTTSADGSFSISVPAGNISLDVSYVGFSPVTVPVSADQTTVTVMMQQSSNTISDVVVTALGITRQSKTLVYATQTVKTSELTGVRDPNNMLNSLQGKVANAIVTQGSGGPGSAAKIVLRGNRFIGDNNALIVVDGVPITNNVYSTAGSDFGSIQSSDGASNINPDDIESVTVLKGAAAATLYGSAGANGAVVITTKKGTKDKYSVTLNAGYTSETPFALPNFQDVYGQGNGGVLNTTVGDSWGAKMEGQSYTNYLGQESRYSPQPDNVRDFFRTGASFNNSIGISGGSEKMQTYLSYTNNAVNGIVPENSMMRHTVTLRLTNQISSKLSTDAKITYINQRIDGRPRTGEENAPVIDAYQMPRSMSINDAKQFEEINNVGIPQPTPWPSTLTSIYQNPYWMIYRTNLKEHRDRVMGFVSVKYKLTDWLSITGRANLDKITDLDEEQYSDGTILWATQGGGKYQKGYYTTTQQWYDAILSGNNTLTKDFKINYNVGAIFQDNKFNQDISLADGLTVTNKFSLNFAKNLSSNSYFVQSRTESVFGQANVSWRDGLYLDAAVRTDWASPLPKPYSYTYYSLGLTGVISDMLQLPEFISFLKLSANYAEAGSGGEPQIRFPVYNYSQGAGNGFLSRGSTLPIDSLKPQISKSFEAGLEARFVQNRIGFSLSYYKTNSENQLLTIALPVATGYSSKYINAGKLENHGWELVINGTPVRGKNFTWDVSFNASMNRNKVISIGPDLDIVYLGGGYGRAATPVVQVGGSFGDLLAYTWAKNDKGQLLVDNKGRPVSSAAQEFIGNFNPKEILGFTNTFNYKGVSLRILLDGRIGGTIVSGTEMNLAFSGITAGTEKYREGGWVLGGVDNTGGAGGDSAISAQDFWQIASGKRYGIGQFFAYDATSFRLREIALGYAIPIPQHSFIKGANISVVARNLFWLYRGKSELDIPGLAKRDMPFDPDMSLGVGNYQGVEYGTLPSTRSIGVNLRLTF
ncbi:MAG TPA: SusC/RagA family TonB-linked outer membrane protein [Parafilimonas sp.]|nr:SusC/RagA family TonB-linked outer membrane protein [Parafilimonas sp.]